MSIHDIGAGDTPDERQSAGVVMRAKKYPPPVITKARQLGITPRRAKLIPLILRRLKVVGLSKLSPE